LPIAQVIRVAMKTHVREFWKQSGAATMRREGAGEGFSKILGAKNGAKT
jgi:hypothetical protein